MKTYFMDKKISALIIGGLAVLAYYGYHRLSAKQKSHDRAVEKGGKNYTRNIYPQGR